MEWDPSGIQGMTGRKQALFCSARPVSPVVIFSTRELVWPFGLRLLGLENILLGQVLSVL